MPLVPQEERLEEDTVINKYEIVIDRSKPINQVGNPNNLETSYGEKDLFITVDKYIEVKLNDSVSLRFYSRKDYKEFVRQFFNSNYDMNDYLNKNNINF